MKTVQQTEHHLSQFPLEDVGGLAALIDLYPEIRDLASTNPPLAVALANAKSWDTFGLVRGDRQFLGRLLRQRRRRICGALGYPASERVVRILAKVAPEACRVKWLAAIRSALRNPSILSILSHLPTIGAAELHLAAILGDAPPVSLALFVDLAWHHTRADEVKWGRLLRQTAIVLGMHQGESERFRSVQHVVRCYYRQWGKLAKVEGFNPMNSNSTIPEFSFPPAPFPGRDEIQPIDSTSMLVEEARTMNHCVFSYLERVGEGDSYLYRVMNPERATLLIVCRGTRWHLEELAGIANRKVSDETATLVETWLETCQTP